MLRAQYHGLSWILRTALFAVGTICASIYLLDLWKMRNITIAIVASAAGIARAIPQNADSSKCISSRSPDTSWHAPNQTVINSLSSVTNNSGIYDYIFNSSITPSGVPYSTYNWCNMPHVRAQEYKIPDSDYQLQYVEVIQRHHKRTPYASNTFPLEAYPWLCDESSLYYYGAPQSENHAAEIAWSIDPGLLNPFPQTGFPNSTCQFPQITGAGLYDSRQHGADLRSAYLDKLHLLPDAFDSKKIAFRVTNNVITSQVAGQVAIGLYPDLDARQLRVTVQPVLRDTLEPQYSCPAATSLYSSYGVGSNNTAWLAHLNDTAIIALFRELDSISGVSSNASDWHTWFDHYFDNLSAKLCHQKALPCNITNPSLCINESIADAVFRRGLYEYSYLYRDAPQSLAAATGSFGLWVSELAYNLRGVMQGTNNGIIYRHNIAHDGSLSRLLSILQVDVMVWPGMGSEIVFELYQSKSSRCWFLRVLWKGEVFRSSSPSLGYMDMVPVDTFLTYVDELVGVRGVKVPGLCASSETG